MRAEYMNNGMNHIEGGWPKDVNTADEEQTKRYRRKIEKDEGYTHTMLQLCKVLFYVMNKGFLKKNHFRTWKIVFYKITL